MTIFRHLSIWMTVLSMWTYGFHHHQSNNKLNSTLTNIADIRHAFYINLYNRPDNVEAQLHQVGIAAKRFGAIPYSPGHIGCSKTHLSILQMAKRHEWDYVLIVEDDISFLDPKLFIKQFNSFLTNHVDFDVVLLAGNNYPPYKRIDESCVQVTHCQTTTGYMVRRHYYSTLIANIEEGLSKLLLEPDHHREYAIDQYWGHLQRQGRWYLITPLSVTQRQDKSDIENRTTNYTHNMLDLDKIRLNLSINATKQQRD